MAFIYNNAKHLIGSGALDLSTVDLRVALVMTNTTADTEQDAANLAAITTLDEHDGSGYARVALTGEAYAKDAPNNRSELDADDVVFSSLGAGTRQCAGALLYQHVDGTAANDVPVGYIDGGSFPFDATGNDVTIVLDAQGLVHVK